MYVLKGNLYLIKDSLVLFCMHLLQFTIYRYMMYKQLKHWPWYCSFHVYVIIFYLIVCGLFVWKRICVGFYVCLYLYCWRSSYQNGRLGSQLIGLTPTHFCACLKIALGFPTSLWRGLYMFNERWLFYLLRLVEL